MRCTKRAAWKWLLGLVLAFAGGVGVSAGVLQRDAHAQPVATTTIYVPAGGLVFRAADGTLLARLSRGPRGGSFVLYDEHGEAHAPASHEVQNNPFVLDDGDPFKPDGASHDWPGPGF